MKYLVLLALSLAVAGCGSPPPAVQPAEPPTVTVANSVQRKLKPQLEFNGRIEARESVNIVAEVGGEIKIVHFKDKEGKTVEAGEALYEIDPIPYRAAVARADADIKNWETQLTTARNELQRLEGIGAKSEIDKAKAAVGTGEGNLGLAKADRVKAQFNLDKTKIKAPIAGRIARTEKTEGNVVTANVTLLTRITSVSPVYALFDVDERTSLYYRKMIAEGVIPDPNKVPLDCWIKLKNEDKFARKGSINYIDPIVSRDSASRVIRGTFLNEDKYITPGDTVRVRIAAGPERDTIQVPEVAIYSQQAKKFVYVLNANDEALPREVDLGEVVDGMQIIEKGLAADERVIVNGLLRVRPGIKVKPVVDAPPKSAAK